MTGDDLVRHGIRPSPAYRWLLEQLRDAQLDGQIGDGRQALALADQLLQQGLIPRGTIMDKKAKKKSQTLRERLQKLRQQLAGAKGQVDDPGELRTLEKQIADTEAELVKLKDD